MLRFIFINAALGLTITGFVIATASQGWFVAPSCFLEIVTLFTVTNIAIYIIIARIHDHPAGDFVRIYLGITVLRIIFFGAFILAVILMDRPGAPKNALFFLVCYFLFTILEVVTLFLKIDTQKTVKRGQKDH